MSTIEAPAPTSTNGDQPVLAGDRPASVLDQAMVWSHRYKVEIHLDTLTGGIPSDPKVAAGWLKTRLFGEEGRDDQLQQKLQQTLVERLRPKSDSEQETPTDPEVALDEALAEAAMNVNGFKRTKGGVLYVEGRCIKAMLKEATSIGLASGHTPKRLGLTSKGPVAYVAEHIQVIEDVCEITRDGEALTEADEVEQHFVHTWRGNSIGYSEVVSGVQLSFTITADVDVEKLLRTTLVIAEQNGLGARRSQGSGRFVVTRFDV
jgi:hypothetical protein